MIDSEDFLRAAFCLNGMPEIVVICGSTRFFEDFQRVNYELTMQGKIVLTVGFYPHSAEQAHGEAIGITPAEKEELDKLHFWKIDLAAAFGGSAYIVNRGGYIGESTRNEISRAEANGMRITYMEEL